MINNKLFIFFIIFIFLMITLFIFHFSRYTIVGAGNGRAYKLDRLTGKTYYLYGKNQLETID